MRNSSYSLMPILLKLYRLCDHTLKICMWFGYNPRINFCHFFRNSNLGIFSGILTMKANGQWVPCVRISYSFIPIALKLYICYGHGMKICMWFGYNPLIFFFFSQFEFSHFFRHFSEWIEGTLCAQHLLQFNTDSFETLQTS